MSKLIRQKVPAVCSRLDVSQKDLLGIDKNDLIQMLFLLHLVREFESSVLDLKDEGLINGPAHVSIGQEAIAAAAGALLRKTDMVGSTHRAHGHFLAKAVMYYAPDHYLPLQQEITQEMQQAVNKTLAEIMGLAAGWCSGRGGSMHLYDSQSGNLGSNAIVAGGIPLATGAAWAEKMKAGDNIVISFFGDGAINQGCFHEVANMAAIYKLPILYFVENNFYAVGTGIGESSSCENLGQRSLGYGIDSIIVDGMDPIAVHAALQRVMKEMRNNSVPYLIEAETYRFQHHAGRLPGSLFGYRTKEEEGLWSARDPLIVFPEKLIKAGFLTEKDNDALKQKAIASVDEAVAFSTAGRKDKMFIPADKWPELDSLENEVRCEDDLFGDVRFLEPEDVTDFETKTYVEAISETTLSCMKRDDRVFVIGEEVGHLNGGAYQATKGINKLFPERLISTPISECGFVGMAGGAASVGMHPVVEIMFPDFALVAADQLFNQIGKLRHMYGGKASFPVVVRTRVAIGEGYGGQHSMSPAGFFALFSGWRVMAPSNSFDCIGMLNTAMRFNDPVLIIEHAKLYAEKGDVPKDDREYFIPYGKARVVREGSGLTVLTYLTGVRDALIAAENLSGQGIHTEVIDLRTLDYIGMDYDTIGTSVKKTGRVLIVEDVPRSMGLSGRIADEIQERFFEYLAVPIARITAPDVPPPVSKVLEDAMTPTVKDIEAGMLRTVEEAATAKSVAKKCPVASPLARKAADNLGLELQQIRGSGPRGKIMKADVVNDAAAHSLDARLAGEKPTEERLAEPDHEAVAVNSMRRTIADRLSASKFTAPHVYFFTEVSMEPLLALKTQITQSPMPGDPVKISINDLLIKATALTLKEFPYLNATFDGDNIKLWKEINIGLAVAVDNGLIVPAIPDADKSKFHDIARKRTELVSKARSGQLGMAEIERGTFTISSLAGYDIHHFSAIINPPQSAILSIGPTLEKPVVAEKELKIGKVAVFGISVDHRIVDGAMAAGFLTELKRILENTSQMLLKMN